MALDLKKMSIEEKLQIMETIWDDICRDAPDFSSPEWHEAILKAREKRVREGKEKTLDWNQAKEEIRNSL